MAAAAMNSQQYEELCRLFLAQQFQIDVGQIRSGRIRNPQRDALPQYKHQVDLSWESSTGIARYLHIANAKWRRRNKVDQPDVLLLEQVRQQVAAHKAIMLTTIGFTAGARAVAEDKGIALCLVKPTIDSSSLPTTDRAKIQVVLQSISLDSSKPPYRQEVVHRAFLPLFQVATRPVPGQTARSYETRIQTGYSTKTITPPASKGSPAAVERRGGGFERKG